ncbi:MAG: GTP 3',8-cyclase MoaA [Acidobacteriota bacterium]|nr:GTP 3',8-cyclase MoaA [Acidobacteriota bacterium]
MPVVREPLDQFGRPIDDLRISIIDRCNFRCTFCMPKDNEYKFLPREELLSFEEIERLARVFVGLGVTKLRLTGGEPLLRAEVEKLIGMLAGIAGVTDLALTTNGYLLADKAPALAAAGLHRVTVSLQSLRDEVFGRLNGLGYKIADVLAGIDAAAEAGLGPIKINVVVMKDTNDDEIGELASYFKVRGHVVRFIEFMDVGTLNHWDPEQVISAREIRDRVARSSPIEQVPRDRPGEVADRFRYIDDGVEVGTIASVTEPFCGDCSRARLSADGRLFTCLFASEGHDFKALLRSGGSDDELAERVAGIWDRRSDRYSEERSNMLEAEAPLHTLRRVEMFRIGG